MPFSMAPDYLTHTNVFTAREAGAVRNTLSAKGVRLLPYPFGSAMAVLSDVDSSRRRRYEGYVGELVDELGLDFGDSTWLTWHHYTKPFQSDRDNKVINSLGFGFFTPWFTTGTDEPAKRYDNTRTFCESIAEFHKGNVDHLHSFLARGVRVVPVSEFQMVDDDRLRIAPKSLQSEEPWTSDDVFLMGICVVGRPGAAFQVESIVIDDRDASSATYVQAPFDGPPGDGRQYSLFKVAGDPDDAPKAARLDRLNSMTIAFGGPGQTAGVERVLILTAYGDMLLDRLEWLQDRFNVEINTITEHSRFHFRHKSKALMLDAELREHIRSYAGPLEAYNGTLHDESGNLIFSTTSDEPNSFGCVFPGLTQRLEVRFVNPIATMRARGWDPLEVVTPCSTRAGGGVYFARRSKPNLVEPPEGKMFDGTLPRHDTFARRVTLMLEDMEREPGHFWPMYTHLGSWGPEAKFEHHGNVDALGAAVPTPYFEPGAMRGLQDHVFNISGTVAPPSRVWFARGSTHYDYALMLRSIGDHVSRPDADTVSIRSWDDSVLGKRLPRSPSQLYGLTFYCDDSARAQVLLDGEPLETLFRNPADETGRPSVTIAECDIRDTVFHRLDPAANPESEVSMAGARWTWRAAEGEARSFGRLTLETAPEGGRAASGRCPSMTVALHGWVATGAQALSFRVRGAEHARIAVLCETSTGGRFLFGDGPPEDFGVPAVTASYQFDPRERAAEEWRRLTAPFHGLAWSAEAHPGGPFPSHALDRVTLLVAGAPGDDADFADLAFLRPRTTSRAASGQRAFCLGGQLIDFSIGEIVHAVPAETAGGEARETRVDQRGFFCFDRMTPGIYEVWAGDADDAVHDRRGRLVELDADTMSLALSRH